MQIHELIQVLRKELMEVKFDDLLNKLPLIQHESIRAIKGRQIDTDIIDVDIDTIMPNRLRYDYTITLRRIGSYIKIPKEYITIGKDICMADNIEVFVGNAGMICTDVLQDDEGIYYTKTPISFGDIDTNKLYESLGRGYSITEVLEAITDTITDGDTLIRVLNNIKEFYDYVEE